jgi:hypothetical protein
MTTRRLLTALLIIGVSAVWMLTMIACSNDDDGGSGPENTPTPQPTPTITPTPTGAWGYVSGEARVLVSNLPDNPIKEKEVIFCLGNPDNRNWVNVRHRTGNKFQLKGGIDPDTPCVGELHIFDAQPAGNGEWWIEWNEDGIVHVGSPNGRAKIQIEGGTPAFRSVYDGSCGGYITWSSPATVELLEISGKVGYSTGCDF